LDFSRFPFYYSRRKETHTRKETNTQEKKPTHKKRNQHTRKETNTQEKKKEKYIVVILTFSINKTKWQVVY